MIDDTYPPLAAWLHGERVAQLTYDGLRGVQLQYTTPAVERFGINGLALSASLPVRVGPYPPDRCAPYLDRLLPEGNARSLLERRFGVPRGDTFHLLEALGRDCAGAVVIIDADERPTDAFDPLRAVSETEIRERLRALPTHPLGVDDRVRLSLAGMQAKLLLTQLPTGAFALPNGTTPSTHILKPGITGFPGLCANECWCLRLADRAGLWASDATLASFGDEDVLVVRRYDRVRDGGGVLHRVHQEDACQALGIPIPSKYEYDRNGPSLRRIASLLRRIAADPAADLDRLAELAVFTVAIGNADLHGRNISLLYPSDGPRLAPIYDAVATVMYDQVSAELGMSIGDARQVTSVSADDLIAEMRAWGMSSRRSSRVLERTLARLHAAIDEATGDVPTAAPVAEIVRGRVERLQKNGAGS